MSFSFPKIVNFVLGNFGVHVSRTSYFNKIKESYLPDPIKLANRFKIDVTSILHIGAHAGDEADVYSELGVKNAVFIEADPDTYRRLEEKLVQFPSYRGINACLGDQISEVNFYISNNDGASSSVLKPKRHLYERPDVKFLQNKTLQMITLNSLGLGNFDLIVIDVQGAEELVINGGWDSIVNAKALYLECNIGNMYDGDTSLEKLVRILDPHFYLVYVDMNSNFWGDCMFINKLLR